MLKTIQLTTQWGDAIFVNPAAVAYVSGDTETEQHRSLNARVHFIGGSGVDVRESVRTVDTMLCTTTK